MTVIRLALLGSLFAASVAACSGGGSETGKDAGTAGTSMGDSPAGGSGGAAGLGGASAGSGAGGTGITGGAGGTGITGGAGAGGSTVGCAPLAPIPRRLLALDPAQYGNATRDLLSLADAPSVPGTTSSSRIGPDLAIDVSYLYGLYQAAGTIVTQVASRAAALAACSAGETDVACATRFARSFGRKAFRRALDDVEVTDIMNVFATVCPGPSQSCASPADFATAVNLAIKAFVLAPSFLYRTELGPRSLTASAAGVYPDTTLTADEVATQLGFLLLDSTPDAGLLTAADSGALGTPAGILTEINRLLALPATQSNATGMVARWLGVDLVAERTKDPTFLSPLTGPDQDQATIAAELRTSWDRAVDATLWSSPPGKVTDLLTSQTFYADGRLATLYGLPHGATADATFNEITWPTVQPRAGILTHPAFLWAVSDPANVSPVKRGKVIHDNVVCQDPVASEPVLTSPEAMAVLQMGDSEATHSDGRLASGALCADNCHSELDPYGRLLHHFDPVGNYRTVDEVGRPIDPSATLTASSPLGRMTFSGPVAFAQALVSSKVFAGCAVRRFFEAALDVSVPARNTCQINDLRAAFDQSDGTMASLLRQITVSNFARARAGGAQ